MVGGGVYAFRLDYQDWLLKYQEATYSLVAAGGTDSWYALVRMAEIVAESPTHIVIEYAINDAAFGGTHQTTRTNGWWTCQEALIVQFRTQLPNAKLIFVNIVGEDDYHPVPAYATSRDNWNTVLDHHDVLIYKYRDWLVAKYGRVPTEAEFNLWHDGVHLTEAGHHDVFDMIEASAANYYPPNTGAGWTSNLADYQPYNYNDVADWMGSPIIRNGTDNDGETGTGWSTNGTARRSSTADDTISWTGTMTAFGIDLDANNCTFAWSVDGGAYTNVNWTTGSGTIKPLSAITRGSHTVTIKVVSGTVEINRFLAV